MSIKIEVELGFHWNQLKIINDKSKVKVIAKGRRFGITRGLAKYCIERMIEKKIMVLWVDTTYSNIQRYYDRYFLPELKQLPKRFWKYNMSRSELKIIYSILDLRSADRPENLEGFGYNLIMMNEAGIILQNEKLWNESIRPMAIDFDAEIIIAGTPKGKRNKKGEKHLFYELYERGLKKDTSHSLGMTNNWRSFQFSSYDNPLLSKKDIDELAKEISPQLRDQEIFGKFVDYQNESIIKRDWWLYFKEIDISKEKLLGVFQSWDCAFKKNEENDYSVCTTWKVTENKFYLIDLFRERLEFPELKRKAVELYEKFNPREILIEDKASGQSLIQELKRETRLPIREVQATRDKVARVHSITPLIESGKVLLMDHETASIIINECEEFPISEHDDIVDSISQFLNYAKSFANSFEPIILKRIERKRFY